MALTLLLDSCVLWAPPLRALWLDLHDHGVIVARWSTGTPGELGLDLPAAGAVSPAPHAIDLPDPDDAHVLGAALACRADALVTVNLRDFPAQRMPLPIWTPNRALSHVHGCGPVLARHDRAELATCGLKRWLKTQ